MSRKSATRPAVSPTQARRLRCDRIVVGTARKSALVRAVGNSLTSQLLESSPVPVEVVGGAPAGALERVGIPAGVGAGMAWLLVRGDVSAR